MRTMWPTSAGDRKEGKMTCAAGRGVASRVAGRARIPAGGPDRVAMGAGALCHRHCIAGWLVWLVQWWWAAKGPAEQPCPDQQRVRSRPQLRLTRRGRSQLST